MLDRAARARSIDLQDAGECQRFDAFVRGRADGTPFHLTAWGRAIARGLGHRAHYLIAERGAAVVGVLPLTHVRSPIFGASLVSQGFAVYGGPLADDAGADRALDDAAWALAGRLGVGSIEYRDQARLRPEWPAKSETYATFKRTLGRTSDENLKAIPRKQRAEVRKSLDFGLETRIGREADDIARHHAVYAESVRNLGTPVFPRALFAAVIEAFGQDADVLTVSKDGRPLASVLSLYHGAEVLPYWGGGVPDARTWRANDHMYWRLMEHARERGLTGFDFGRSKTGTGPYAFKKNWGFEPAALHYEFRLGDRVAMPDLNPNSPKFRAMTRVWSKLPLWLANRLGPPIARGLG